MIVNTINIIIIRNLIDGDHFFNFVNNSMNKRLFFKYNIILTNLLLPLDIFKLNLNSTLYILRLMCFIQRVLKSCLIHFYLHYKTN
jgi:hypothetical protein